MDAMSKYSSLGIVVEHSADALYTVGLYMTLVYAGQRLLPGMVLSAINDIDTATQPYKDVTVRVKSATPSQRIKLTWKPGNELGDPNAQLLDVRPPPTARPGDRVRARTPDRNMVEVVMPQSEFHRGEDYTMLLSRAIPIEGGNSRNGAQTQTVGETAILADIQNIQRQIQNGDRSREAELPALMELQSRVKRQGLLGEINILRETGSLNGSMSNSGYQVNASKQQRLRQLEQELQALQNQGPSGGQYGYNNSQQGKPMYNNNGGGFGQSGGGQGGLNNSGYGGGMGNGSTGGMHGGGSQYESYQQQLPRIPQEQAVQYQSETQYQGVRQQGVPAQQSETQYQGVGQQQYQQPGVPPGALSSMGLGPGSQSTQNSTLNQVIGNGQPGSGNYAGGNIQKVSTGNIAKYRVGQKASSNGSSIGYIVDIIPEQAGSTSGRGVLVISDQEPQQGANYVGILKHEPEGLHR
jgi:hypothetical protein